MVFDFLGISGLRKRTTSSRPASPILSPSSETGFLSSLEDYIEDALVCAQTHLGDEAFVQAREDFFWKMGKVFHDDACYEKRMNYFWDYFLLERPISKDPSSGTAIKFKEAKEQERIITKAVHGVFELRKQLSPFQYLVLNLGTGDKYIVHSREQENFSFLEKRQLIQGFVYEVAGRFMLSNGVIYHPSTAKKMIKRAILTSQRGGPTSLHKLLCFLAKQNLRCLRHPQLDPVRVYSEPI